MFSGNAGRAARKEIEKGREEGYKSGLTSREVVLAQFHKRALGIVWIISQNYPAQVQ